MIHRAARRAKIARRLARAIVLAGVASAAVTNSGAPAEARTAAAPHHGGYAPGASADTAATAVMQRLERAFLAGGRALRFDATTTTAAGQVIERTSWGMLSGDGRGTRLIYVFTAPSSLAGATLLMRFRDPRERDSTWLYLPGFQRVLRIGPGAQKVLVPGTALSYADARGYLPTDRYRFTVYDTSANRAGGDTLWIAAVPAADSIRRDLGYGRLLIAVDRARDLVARVEFAGDDLRPLKSYRVLEAVRVGGAWLPSRARIDHRQSAMSSEIVYRYWPLQSPPPATLFDPADARGAFLPRMLDALRRERIPVGGN